MPMVDFDKVREVYFRVITQVCSRELKRNVVGKSCLYKYNPRINYNLSSWYGDIPDCHIKMRL